MAIDQQTPLEFAQLTGRGFGRERLSFQHGGTLRSGYSQQPKLNVANPHQHCPGESIINHSDIPPCAGCGRCCHLVVALKATDLVPEEFVVEHDGVRCLEQRSDGACVALDHTTQLCTIYENRPQTCRDFNRGENLCRRILSQPRRQS